MSSEYFEQGVEYVFDKAKYAKSMRIPLHEVPNWAKVCDGIVVNVTSKNDAVFDGYCFVRAWCMTKQEYEETYNQCPYRNIGYVREEDTMDKNIGYLIGIFLLSILTVTVVQILLKG